MADFEKQFFDHYNLTTAQIFYHLPDYPKFLQEFVWQDYDLAPKFPRLRGFLNFWTREIDGRLHSVYVASKKIIVMEDTRFLDIEITV